MERPYLILAIVATLLALLVNFWLGIVYGWAIFVTVHYLHVRRGELLHLLTTAAEKGMPLAPALRAYVHDRPRSYARGICLAVVLALGGIGVALLEIQVKIYVAVCVLLFLPSLFWLWSCRSEFDRKVQWLAKMLEAGWPLHEALQKNAVLATSETILGAAVGESTGDLAGCLRKVSLRPLAPVWLEVLPRLAYPLFILGMLLALQIFTLKYVIPKFEKIFIDFHLQLPAATKFFIGLSRMVFRPIISVPLVGFLLAAIVTLLASSKVCWYCPILGRYYRMYAQSRLLSMLGLLMEVDKPLPAALETLLEADFFTGEALKRMTLLHQRIEQGEPLAENMERLGLMPASMTALVQAAGRAHNLPWALAELGDALARRLVRNTQRLTMTIFPLLVLAAGLLVGFIAYAMFMPLLYIMAGVA